MRSAVALFFATTLLAAPAPPEPAKLPVYFCTSPGAQWTYESSTLAADIVVVTTEVRHRPNGDIVIRLCDKVLNQLTQREQVGLTTDGMWSVELKDANHHSPCPHLLKMPHRDGQTWSSSPLPLSTGITTTDSSTAKRERVKVPAGEYDAIRVDTVYTTNGNGSDGSWSWSDWYAAGVGLVKHVTWEGEREGNGTLKLKAFTADRK